VEVLVAHTDPAARAALREALASTSLAVRSAETTEEVLTEVRANGLDVVVLDHRLAGPRGRVVREIKADRTAYNTSVVLVAPPSAPRLAELASPDLGVHDVLLEPIVAVDAMARVCAAARAKALSEALLDQARRLEVSLFEDSLTGVYNRRFVMTQLASLISGARRHGRPLSVAMIDIDRFKAFNDRYGHAVGDRVLQIVAGALQDRMRGEDCLGRLGGEEFLALLTDTDEDAAPRIAERLRATVEAVRVPTDAGLLHVTVSLGWATWDEEEDVDALVRRADEALYAAKAGGRDRVEGAATLRRRV
jgi:two-component system cell cycle response regulator